MLPPNRGATAIDRELNTRCCVQPAKSRLQPSHNAITPMKSTTALVAEDRLWKVGAGLAHRPVLGRVALGSIPRQAVGTRRFDSESRPSLAAPEKITGGWAVQALRLDCGSCFRCHLTHMLRR